MILLYLVVAALYGVAAWLRSASSPVGTRAGVATVLIVLALVAQAITLGNSVFTPDGLDLSFQHALSLVAWLTVLVALTSGVLTKLPAVGAVILPVAAVCALAPLAGGSPHRFPYAGASWATVHIAIALVAYALLVVAALQALLLTGLEKRLRRGLALPEDGSAVPLLTLERFLFRLVGAGFVLLTLTLASGLLFSEELFGRPVTFNHKNLFSVLGWLTIGMLLFGRWRYGWRGRRALYWILAGTALLVLGYLGSKFVSEIVLGR
ncbi:MAG: cytochrome c biogenesis protein CcsA [Burkholderiales bacterium]|nr:cytochrome c biogenesis protein CcsA [Burkholderiales bacterium]